MTLTDEIRSRLRETLTPPTYVTMRSCAKTCGVSVSTVSRFVWGHAVSSDALDKFADFVGARLRV